MAAAVAAARPAGKAVAGDVPSPPPNAVTGRYGRGAILPTGRLVDPAGSTTALGDFPVAIAVAPSGGFAVVANSGQGQADSPDQGNETLQVVDTSTGAVKQTIADHDPGQPTFYNAGLAFSPDGQHLYAAGGGNDAVYDYAVMGKHLALAHHWVSTSKHQATYSGAGNLVGYSRAIAVSSDGKRVYVTNEQGGSVVSLSTTDGSIKWEQPLGTPGMVGGSYPEGIALSPDGGTAYVAAQGANVLFGVNTATGAVTSTTPVGDHPEAVALTKDGTLAFVTNANDDSLSVIDLTRLHPLPVATLSTHLVAGEANGSTPIAVTIDEHNKLVYVANAGDDDVAVIGTRIDRAPATWQADALHVLGFIPTTWYPTAVALTNHNTTLLSTTAKGYGGVPVVKPTQYDGNDMVGMLGRITVPPSNLDSLTARARRATTWGQRENLLRSAGNPIPDDAHRGQSPIKHVVVVVRENRTFDQVFGDLAGKPGVNADPALLEFPKTDARGRTITPNAHAIAAQYGLSDNFYSDGEASIQGHHWTVEGNSTDYTEKSWLHYYSNRFHPSDEVSPIVYPRCGSVFSQLAANGISFKDFGELEGVVTKQTPTVAIAPDAKCAVPGGAYDHQALAALDPAYANNIQLTSVPDTDRLAEFKRAYAPLVAANQVPSFSYLLMGNDHTDGTTPSAKTPQAFVATNDDAVGGLIDYLSHTPQWSSTAVFIEEDDSQDGLDHVDGHRNILIVASPYASKHAVSHVHVSQAGVMHTIELILGLPPMSAYTQLSPVPYDLFQSTPHMKPYTAVTPTYPMDKVNPTPPAGSASSVPIDVSRVDVAGPVLEAQLWEATRMDTPLPPQLVAELRERGGISEEALAAWSKGQACSCDPRQQGAVVRAAPPDADG
jgi:YVTN family beta-propeller protein